MKKNEKKRKKIGSREREILYKTTHVNIYSKNKYILLLLLYLLYYIYYLYLNYYIHHYNYLYFNILSDVYR